jgi:hypothetical protein
MFDAIVIYAIRFGDEMSLSAFFGISHSWMHSVNEREASLLQTFSRSWDGMFGSEAFIGRPNFLFVGHVGVLFLQNSSFRSINLPSQFDRHWRASLRGLPSHRFWFFPISAQKAVDPALNSSYGTNWLFLGFSACWLPNSWIARFRVTFTIDADRNLWLFIASLGLHSIVSSKSSAKLFPWLPFTFARSLRSSLEPHCNRFIGIHSMPFSSRFADSCVCCTHWLSCFHWYECLASSFRWRKSPFHVAWEFSIRYRAPNSVSLFGIRAKCLHRVGNRNYG